MPSLVADHHRLVVDPHERAVLADRPVLHHERLARLVVADVLGQRPGAVVGMQDALPQVFLLGPLLRGVAHQRLDLRADVDRRGAVVHGVDVDRRQDHARPSRGTGPRAARRPPWRAPRARPPPPPARARGRSPPRPRDRRARRRAGRARRTPTTRRPAREPSASSSRPPRRAHRVRPPGAPGRVPAITPPSPSTSIHRASDGKYGWVWAAPPASIDGTDGPSHSCRSRIHSRPSAPRTFWNRKQRSAPVSAPAAASASGTASREATGGDLGERVADVGRHAARREREHP